MNFIGEFLRESKGENKRGRCLHYEGGYRCNEMISAHSIQNNGQLSLISEAGHVYRLSTDIETLRKSRGALQLKKVGVNKASTFLGFCKAHDNALFKPIDQSPLEPNKLQIALYAYRCLCREYFVKENAVSVMTKMKSHPELNDDQRQLLENMSLGNTIGFSGLKYHKAHYDQALTSSKCEQFEYVCFTSTSSCNVQLSGLLYPDFDFNGSFLQDLNERHVPLDLITFFTAPIDGGWAFCFAWHTSSSKTCIPFIQSLALQGYRGTSPAETLLRFSLSCCENHAIRISWWDGLSDKAKQQLLDRMQVMAHPEVPIPSNYLAIGCEGIADWEFQYVHTSMQ